MQSIHSYRLFIHKAFTQLLKRCSDPASPHYKAPPGWRVASPKAKRAAAAWLCTALCSIPICASAGQTPKVLKARVMAFGSITDKELGMATKLAHACYKAQPAAGCNEETKYSAVAMADPATTLFAFPGSHNAQDWKTNALNDMKPLSAWANRLRDLSNLPQLAHQGFVDRLAVIAAAGSTGSEPGPFNKAFDKAAADKQRILFVGHSLGGAVAIVATIWALMREPKADVACITFGAPLVGDKALRKLVLDSGWDKRIHQVVWRHDMVPRILLSPGAYVKKGLSVIIDKLPRFWMHEHATGATEETQVGLDPDQKAALQELRETMLQEAAAASPHKGKAGICNLTDAGKYVGSVAGSLGKGLAQVNAYSPFGIYLLHTDGGSLVCDDADEAAQMLFLTLQRLSNAIDARPWYVVSEHMMPRYETAVAAYLADAEAEPKKWSALTYEARSMYELGVVMALNDQSKELQEILRLLKRGATEDGRGSAKEERELAKEWTKEVQEHMDLIFKYTDELAADAPELHDGSTALAEAYRLGKLPENVNKEVEAARRALRDFWRYAVKMYGEEELPQSFFSNKSVWLARARTFRRLVEPFDIAVYYRYALWKKWQPGRRHYHESDNRPEYFAFIEAQLSQEYPDEPLEPTLPYAQRLADECNRSEVTKQLDQVVEDSQVPQAV